MLSIERALPLVAAKSVTTVLLLTPRDMLTAGDEFEHSVVHLNEAAIGKGVFLLALGHGLLDLGLEEVGLERVDHLNGVLVNPEAS